MSGLNDPMDSSSEATNAPGQFTNFPGDSSTQRSLPLKTVAVSAAVLLALGVGTGMVLASGSGSGSGSDAGNDKISGDAPGLSNEVDFDVDPKYLAAHAGYVDEVTAAGLQVMLPEARMFASEAQLVCNYDIAEMSGWMRQQIERGLWFASDLQTPALNYGSLIRQACPDKVVAFTEAARDVLFSGGTGTIPGPNSAGSGAAGSGSLPQTDLSQALEAAGVTDELLREHQRMRVSSGYGSLGKSDEDDIQSSAYIAVTVCQDVLNGKPWQQIIDEDIDNGAPSDAAESYYAYLQFEFCPELTLPGNRG